VTDLVVGAAGFVGRYLVEHLHREEREVVTADLSAGNHISCDICDATAVRDMIRQTRPKRVFHLAALSSVGEAARDAGAAYRVNAEGTLNVLMACRDHAPGCRLLFTSTAAVYGIAPETAMPLIEQRRPYPVEVYAASKALAETLCDLMSGDGRIRVIVTRAFNHTGPGQDNRFVVPAMAEQVARVAQGRSEPVIHAGNLDPERDFCDVREVVRAYDDLLHHGERGQTYNVCSGRTRTIRSILQDLLRLAGVDADVQSDPARERVVDLKHMVGDNTALLDAIGWAPRPMGDSTLHDIFEHAMRSESKTAL